jgi:hypothetical protein
MFIPVPLDFMLFMSNNLSFGCVFPFILALFRPPGSGSRRPINADPDPRHWIKVYNFTVDSAVSIPVYFPRLHLSY